MSMDINAVLHVLIKVTTVEISSSSSGHWPFEIRTYLAYQMCTSYSYRTYTRVVFKRGSQQL